MTFIEKPLKSNVCVCVCGNSDKNVFNEEKSIQIQANPPDHFQLICFFVFFVSFNIAA